MDLERASVLNETTPDFRKAEAIDCWAARAQARYFAALVALAKVQRLRLPLILARVHVNGQARGR
jgi:hypothetical protein